MSELIDINLLKPSKYNPRKITKEKLESLKKTIKAFGNVRPVVINKDNTIIGGTQTWTVLKELEHKEIEVIRLDLNENKEKLLNVALNNYYGEWDEEKLYDLLSNVNEEDLGLTGFSEQDIKQIQTDYNYDDLDKELKGLEDEEKECIDWNARFKNKEEFEKVEAILKELKSKNNLSRFTSDFCNSKILKILCEKYEKDSTSGASLQN